MKIYFCEGCGKRLTDSDLESGSAVDKKMAGIFCQDCGAGIATQESTPRKTSSATLHVAPRPNRATQLRIAPASATHVPRTLGTHASTRTHREHSPGTGTYVVIGGGAVLLLVIAGMLVRSSPAPTVAPRTNRNVAVDRPEPVRPPMAIPPVTTKTETRARDILPPDPPGGQSAQRKQETPNREDQATRAFDEVRAFKKLDEKDLDGRVAALEAYLKEYGDTMAGARARAMISSLKSPASPTHAEGTSETINDFRLAFSRGVECAARNDNESALKYYNRAIELRSTFFEAIVNRSIVRRALYDIEGSLEDAEKAAQINSNAWQTNTQLAICLLSVGRTEEALAAIQKARAQHNQPDALERYIRLQGQAFGLVYMGKKLEGKSLTQGADFLARGRYLIATGRPADGIKDVEEAMKLDASMGARGGYQWLMIAYEKNKDWKARMNAAQHWAETTPPKAEALNAYAWELLTSKDEALRDPKTSLATIKKVMENLPAPPAPFLDTYAMALFRNGQKEEAVTQARKALEALPADAAANVRQEYENHLKEYQGE